VIRVTIRFDHHGCLGGFSVSGHSGTAKRGEDPVCAAVTVLFRTAARALRLQPDFGVRGHASESGKMEVQIGAVPARRREWLAGFTDFLLRGIEDLREEYPQAIHLVIEGSE